MRDHEEKWFTPAWVRQREKAWDHNIKGENKQNAIKLYKELISAMIAETGSRPTLLDAGCGMGHLHPYLAPMVDYRGVDISPLMIGKAEKKHPEGDFAVGDIYVDSFTDDEYDIVLSQDVLQHIIEDEKFFEAIYKIAGKLLIIKTLDWDRPTKVEKGDFKFNRIYNTTYLMGLLDGFSRVVNGNAGHIDLVTYYKWK